MSKFDFSHLIDNYLEGSISKSEKTQLFDAMEKDPALKNEFQMQSNIIESLKTYRKVELKARLASIEVGSGATGFIGLKIATVAVVSALLFSGAYYIYNNQNPKLDIGSIEIEKQPIDKAIVPVIPQAVKSEQIVSAKPEKEKVVSKPSISTTKEAQVVNPVVIEPNLISDLEDNELIVNNSQPDFANNMLSKNAEKVKPEVEIVTENSKSFEYKFFNNKLYLYGDFGKIPYEILELNSNQGKRLYLFYQNEYYSLRMNQKDRIPVERVADMKLVKELEIIKNNK